MISNDLQDTLIAHAKEAQEKSYSPYSNFSVGAALITEEDEIFTGSNIENISYGLSMCGERTAIFKMISEKGSKAKIKALAVATKANIPRSPCGACRQVIQEFSTSDMVVIYKAQAGYVKTLMTHLLSDAFTEFATYDQADSERRIQKGI